mmetsp:Transcript_55038/g.81899  ORF Transcript_55038/g.81899 Transcript_55038/m.81899 type:complete len:84 (-) Transcript_55038:233-484(-)
MGCLFLCSDMQFQKLKAKSFSVYKNIASNNQCHNKNHMPKYRSLCIIPLPPPFNFHSNAIRTILQLENAYTSVPFVKEYRHPF